GHRSDELDRPARLQRDDVRVRLLPPELVRGAAQDRERAEVARHDARVAEQLDGHGGLARPHREVVADRQDRVVGLPEPADQRHVAEHARVAGEVDGLALLEADHEAAGFAQVLALVRARRVEGVDEAVGHAVDLDAAALVEAVRVADGEALPREPGLDLDLADELRGGEALHELDRVADVVRMAVRDADRVDPLGRAGVVRRLRVSGQEGVDVDPAAPVALDQERGVPEPGEGCHRPPFVASPASRERIEGSSGAGAKLRLVGRRVLPALLVAAAAAADAHGAHGLALDALLAAVPFAAVAGLAAFGGYLDRRDDPVVALQALLWAVALVLLLVSCEVRSSAIHGVPPLAVSSLVACLGVFAIKAVVAAAPYARRLAALRPAKP